MNCLRERANRFILKVWIDWQNGWTGDPGTDLIWSFRLYSLSPACDSAPQQAECFRECSPSAWNHFRRTGCWGLSNCARANEWTNDFIPWWNLRSILDRNFGPCCALDSWNTAKWHRHIRTWCISNQRDHRIETISFRVNSIPCTSAKRSFILKKPSARNIIHTNNNKWPSFWHLWRSWGRCHWSYRWNSHWKANSFTLSWGMSRWHLFENFQAAQRYGALAYMVHPIWWRMQWLTSICCDHAQSSRRNSAVFRDLILEIWLHCLWIWMTGWNVCLAYISLLPTQTLP